MSSPAEPRVLIRRLYFDLIGLPPSPEEVEEFASSFSPSHRPSVSPSGGDRATERQSEGEKNACIALVDRLLISPHYGERWARHWLDVAHFGESDGFEYDRMRPNAWRYRDWVIEALNRDLPYDEFARLQIAGDVLRPERSQRRSSPPASWSRGAHDSLLPKGEVMQMIMRQDELEDVVGIVGQTFLGLTVHCARCHDHKFDPIRQSRLLPPGRRRWPACGGATATCRPPSSPSELTDRAAEAAGELAAIDDAAREAVLKARSSTPKNGPRRRSRSPAGTSTATCATASADCTALRTARRRSSRGLLVLDGKRCVCLDRAAANAT